MTVTRVASFVLVVLTPTLIGIAFVTAPRWIDALAGLIDDRRRSSGPQPSGPPIEQLAADLRRLLKLHGDVAASAHLATRAHRLWAVEAAIALRAAEAARALEVPYREPAPGAGPDRAELSRVLMELTAAGLVLPHRVGQFTDTGRF